MVGIITKSNVNSLLLEISNKNNDVYWYKDNNLELGIEKLKEKNCNIIITNQDYSKINDSGIKFISLNPIYNDNDYVLENKELITAVTTADEQKVIDILNSINIPTDKDIIIKDTELVFIKHLITNKFNNNVKTINDLILKEIPNSNEEGQIYLIN